MKWEILEAIVFFITGVVVTIAIILTVSDFIK